MKTPSTSHRNHGFTLVELLAVIVIAGILLVGAMQGIKAIGATALQAGARQFANDMQLARQYAITKRTRVRVFLAVDPANIPFGLDSNSIYRAYCIFALSNATTAVRLTDWRILPTGVVFSDNNSSTKYSPVTLATIGIPTNGTRSIKYAAPGAFDNGYAYFYNGTNIVDASTATNYTYSGSGIDFLPTGQAKYYYGNPTGVRAGGVRLAQGIVDTSTWMFNIQNTNNWVYIEYDYMGGRIRTRWSDSYQ